MGLYRDDGKENGNYYILREYIKGFYKMIEKNMETTMLFKAATNTATAAAALHVARSKSQG